MTTHGHLQHFDATFLAFGREMARCYFDLLLTDGEFRRAHSSLTAALQDKPGTEATQEDRARVRSMWIAVPADDVAHPESYGVAIGGRGAQDEQLADALVHIYNSRCSWVLVQGYEGFERLVRRLYADLGYADRAIWRCKEYGSIGTDEVAALPREWFQEQARAHREIDGILNRLRTKLNGLQALEEGNPRRVHFVHWQKTIELFRHQVVHASGTVPSDFDEIVRKAIGMHDLHTLGGDGLAEWLRCEDNERRLWLVDAESIAQGQYTLANRPLKTLMETMTSHACLLYRKSLERSGFTPLWERSQPQTGQGLDTA